MTQTCPKCHAAVAAQLRLCLTCGHPLTPSAQVPLISHVPGAKPVSATPEPAPVVAPAVSWPTPVVPLAPQVPVAQSVADSWGSYGGLAATGGIPETPRRAVMPTAFQFDSGVRLVVGGRGLIGRHPETTEPGVVCTPVDDPAKSVSKTHLEYGTDDQGTWVKDRGSTNGSTLRRPGLAPRVLMPGEVTHLLPGDMVTFGQRSFTVQEVVP